MRVRGLVATCLAALAGAILTAALAGAALAQTPGSPTVLDTLFRKLQEATDPVAAQTLEQAIWEQWTLLPEPAQRGLMFKGIGEMQNRDLAGAVVTFTKLIEIAPDLPEGWNKRATAHWLRGDYPASIKDICETLKREPRHFGALSGLGMIRAEMGENGRAVAAFEMAKKANPHIGGIDAEIARLRALGGEPSDDPLGCGQQTAGR
jgi:tetratricopeptide (TPR) repeat protein